MTIKTLYQKDYFPDQTEMHYAWLQSVEKIGPQLHTHDFYEIFLIVDGKIHHFVNEQSHILSSGALVFIRPHDIHRFSIVENYDCQMINLAIVPKVINELFDYLGAGFNSKKILTLGQPPVLVLTQPNKQFFHNKLVELNNIPIQNRARKQTLLRILLFEFMTQYFSLTQSKDGETAVIPQWLEACCQEMQKPENLSLGVPKMLEIAAVSPEHLSRTFKKQFNQTPTEYVNELRLNWAANLLQHSDLPILDIATEIGFESLSYFYARFKHQFGQTPRQFRAKILYQTKS